MRKVCLEGDIKTKDSIKRDFIRLMNNYQNDIFRYMKQLFIVTIACLLGYFYGKSHINPIQVNCIVDTIYLPNKLQTTGTN